MAIEEVRGSQIYRSKVISVGLVVIQRHTGHDPPDTGQRVCPFNIEALYTVSHFA